MVVRSFTLSHYARCHPGACLWRFPTVCHIAAEGWQMFAANSAIHAFIDSDLCMQQGRIYLSPFPPVLYLDPLCAQRLRSMSQEVRRVSVISCPVLHGSIACCLDVQGFPSIIQDLYHCLWCNHNKASWCRSSRMERNPTDAPFQGDRRQVQAHARLLLLRGHQWTSQVRRHLPYSRSRNFEPRLA